MSTMCSSMALTLPMEFCDFSDHWAAYTWAADHGLSGVPTLLFITRWPTPSRSATITIARSLCLT
jgi:hypothetical protein